VPRYSGSVNAANPLIIQVQSTSSGAGSVASLFAIKAEGQNSTGSASRPVIFRPLTPGSGTAQTPEIRSRLSNEPASCTLLTTFTSSPSLPTVNLGAFNLPIKVSWMVDSLDGIIFSNGGAIALYQNTSGGHKVAGNVSFEEL
jgi:hypothetical protein